MIQTRTECDRCKAVVDFKTDREASWVELTVAFKNLSIDTGTGYGYHPRKFHLCRGCADEFNLVKYQTETTKEVELLNLIQGWLADIIDNNLNDRGIN